MDKLAQAKLPATSFLTALSLWKYSEYAVVFFPYSTAYSVPTIKENASVLFKYLYL